MQTAIEGRAAVVAFRLTIFWLFGLVLLDAAFGLPLEIPAPFGLPADTLGWKEAAIAPGWSVALPWTKPPNEPGSEQEATPFKENYQDQTSEY